MIIRIMGEGQWDVPDSVLHELNGIDSQVEHAVATGSQDELTTALTHLVTTLRTQGHQVPDDQILDSDLIVPDETATVEEVSRLLAGNGSGDGLIPG